MTADARSDVLGPAVLSPDVAGPDVFGTAELRHRVLDAWSASVARFREDGNAEEDLALGAYRDRVVVELAQNAADAAASAGTPGRLLLRLIGSTLVVANVGRPLDAAGVEALSTLRASAKRDAPGQTGRFGVGFAAVRAVADDLVMASTSGAVEWSATRTYELAKAVPQLAEELARRGGVVPALRMPFSAEEEVPTGYDTAVILQLRDGAARQAIEAQLAAVDAVLLLALPALSEITIEREGTARTLRASDDGPVRVVRDDVATTGWRVVRASGTVPPELLTDRPVEERARTSWGLTWALPLDGDGLPADVALPGVVCAPTPTEDRLDIPAVLLGTFPLDSTRRLVAAGPLRDFLADEAGRSYARLVQEVAAAADDPRLLALIPGPIGASEIDGLVRAAALAALAETPWVPAHHQPAGEAVRMRPADAVVLLDAGVDTTSALADTAPELCAAAWSTSRRHGALVRLGARTVALAEALDELASVRWPACRWRSLYAALITDGIALEVLSGLPVPLLDGRIMRGPRSVLLPTELPPAARDLAALLRLPVVDPEASHPLLERLGARPATPLAYLTDPRTEQAVRMSSDGDDAAALAENVLGLVTLALEDGRGDELPDLSALALPTDDGELFAAGELVHPASLLAEIFDERALARVSVELAARWPADVLAAVGVLREFALLHDADVVVDPDAGVDGPGQDLDGLEEWFDDLVDSLSEPVPDGMPPVLSELVAVRDLDAVRPDVWPVALQALAQPPLRAAVTEPAFLVWGGRRVAVPSYSAWWLRNFVELNGRAPTELREVNGDPLLAGVYDDAPVLGIDEEFLRALGVRTTLAALLAEAGGADDLLDRLADETRPTSGGQLRALYAALAAVDPRALEAPTRLRVARADGTAVVDAGGVVVVNAPDLLPLLGDRPHLVVSGELARPLADVLGIALATDVVRGRVQSEGTQQEVPEVVRAVLPDAPLTWEEHDELIVDGHSVDWRVVEGAVHAATLDGLARALSWATGRWSQRLLVAAVLAEPSRLAELRAEAEFG